MNIIGRIESDLAKVTASGDWHGTFHADDVRALLRLVKESMSLEKARWLGYGANYDRVRLDWIKALAALEAPCEQSPAVPVCPVCEGYGSFTICGVETACECQGKPCE